MRADTILNSEMLIVLTVCLLAFAWFSLIVSMIEEFVTRDHESRSREASGAISMMRRMCVPTVVATAFFTASFAARALAGFPSVNDDAVFVTMVNYIVVFAWASLPGTILWFMVLKHRDLSEFESKRSASERERFSKLGGNKDDD